MRGIAGLYQSLGLSEGERLGFAIEAFDDDPRLIAGSHYLFIGDGVLARGGFFERRDNAFGRLLDGDFFPVLAVSGKRAYLLKTTKNPRVAITPPTTKGAKMAMR